MAYKSEWWLPPYTEYNCGVVNRKTWPNVMEQYYKPNNLVDVRHADLPTDDYKSMLYFEKPRLGKPVYKGKQEQKPYTVPSYYPAKETEVKPAGFHSRLYYEDVNPMLKYNGPKKNDLYWLERPVSGK